MSAAFVLVITDGYIPPCIPTRSYKVPAGPDWVHEIKHDGNHRPRWTAFGSS
jgi:hypothetical protein